MRRVDLLEQINKPHYIQRFREITITNNETSDLSDFQIPIEIGGDFLDKANPNNLFLIDSNGVIYPYWVEEWKRPNGKTKIWTKADLLASASKTLYLYYDGIIGNNLPDGDSVFEFFDDFDGGSLDVNKWNSSVISGVAIDIENSNVKISGTSDSSGSSSITSKSTVTGDIELISKIRSKTINDGDTHEIAIRLDADNWVSNSLYKAEGALKWRKNGKSGGSGYTVYNIDRFKNETILKIRRNGTDVNTYYWDGFNWQEIGSVYTGFPTSGVYPRINAWLDAANNTTFCFWDWIYIRKYTTNEPSVSIGSEKTIYK